MKGIMDDHVIRKQIVVIVDPINRKIVASSDREQQERAIMSNNPLATPVLLAIQGVSRIEREAARNLSAVEFSRGQYLCTGYAYTVTMNQLYSRPWPAYIPDFEE